jgi:hypothetical protein
MKYVLLFIWQLPQTLFSLVVFIFAFIFGQIKNITTYKGKLLVNVKSYWGVSFGYVIFLYTDASTYDRDHEYGHCIDSQYFGWLYLPIVGIYSAIYCKCIKKYWCNKWEKYDWHYWYYKIAWTEKRADKFGNVDRDMWLRISYPKTLANTSIKLRYPRV